MINLIPKNTHIDFQKPRRLLLLISGLVILASIVSLIVHGGPNYSIDFEGGLAVTVRFDIPADKPSITEEDIRRTLERLNMANSEVKMSRSAEGEDLMIHFKEEGRFRPPEALIRSKLDEQFSGKWSIVLSDRIAPASLPKLDGISYVVVETAVGKGELAGALSGVDIDEPVVTELNTIDGSLVYLLAGKGRDTVSRLVQQITKDYPNTKFEVRSIDRVGPRIGQELRNKSIWALLATLSLIVIYLWFRFELQFGVAAVIALFHDVMITIGLFSFLDLEISLVVVGAFLTLVGYSLNDTIVVYDRIRENIKRYKDKPFAEVVNISINQTLSRTIITGGTTLLVLVVLFFMGGEVLHNFALVLLAGILIGTYSSIFIASPLLVEYAERTGNVAGKKLGK